LHLITNADTFVIKEQGRSSNESTIVLVKDGIYQGFAFVEKQEKMEFLSAYEKWIELKQENSYIKSILRSYLNKNDGGNLLYIS